MTGEHGVYAWPTQLHDVQRAVRWVRANAESYSVDPWRLAALGHAAGGHLAAFLGVRGTVDWSDPTAQQYSSRMQCVVNLSGDMELTQVSSAAFDHQIARHLPGGTLEEVPHQYRDASCLTGVNAESAPFLIVHAATDDVNRFAHAQVMAAALQVANVETNLVALARASTKAAGGWNRQLPSTKGFPS